MSEFSMFIVAVLILIIGAGMGSAITKDSAAKAHGFVYNEQIYKCTQEQ